MIGWLKPEQMLRLSFFVYLLIPKSNVMVIFWRGAGILVPILWVLSAWILHYFYDDTRFFHNTIYSGWSLIAAGIPLLLIWLGIRSGAKTESEGQEQKKYSEFNHAFMFLPLFVWPVLMIGGGGYLLFTSDSTASQSNNEDVTEYVEEESRIINFWNPGSDSVHVKTWSYETNEKQMNDFVKARSIIYTEFYPGKYNVEYGYESFRIKVRSSTLEGEGFDQYYLALDPDVDLLLVDITDGWDPEIIGKTFTDIVWMDKVEDRYTGNLKEVLIEAENDGQKVSVVDPGFRWPEELGRKEKLYCLVPIPSNEELSEEYLDAKLSVLKFRD